MSDGETRTLASRRLDSLAKPIGSLGRLEDLAVRLAETQGSIAPLSNPRRLLVFAGDHGVVDEGVGPWKTALTRSLMRVMLAGRSSGTALARASDTRFTLVDAGTYGPPPEPHADLRDWRVAAGTANLAQGPAMSEAEFDAALAVGARAVRESVAAGDRVLAVGEIGIGNSTAAACLAALLTGAEVAEVVGPGAGGTAEHLARKRLVVAEALRRNEHRLGTSPRKAMAAVAGFEIIAIAGCIAEAARSRTTVVLDGFIAASAALVAQTLDPAALRTTIASHLGAEPGHRIVLSKLYLKPFLEWKLRLGEGTGALLLLPMLDAAAALLSNVADLNEVAEKVCPLGTDSLGHVPSAQAYNS